MVEVVIFWDAVVVGWMTVMALVLLADVVVTGPVPSWTAGLATAAPAKRAAVMNE